MKMNHSGARTSPKTQILAFVILSLMLQILWNIFRVKPLWLRSPADLLAAPVPFMWKSKSLMRRSASPIVQHLV